MQKIQLLRSLQQRQMEDVLKQQEVGSIPLKIQLLREMTSEKYILKNCKERNEKNSSIYQAKQFHQANTQQNKKESNVFLINEKNEDFYDEHTIIQKKRNLFLRIIHSKAR